MVMPVRMVGCVFDHAPPRYVFVTSVLFAGTYSVEYPALTHGYFTVSSIPCSNASNSCVTGASVRVVASKRNPYASA